MSSCPTITPDGLVEIVAAGAGSTVTCRALPEALAPFASVTVRFTRKLPAALGRQSTSATVLAQPCGSPDQRYRKPPPPPTGSALIVSGRPTSVTVVAPLGPSTISWLTTSKGNDR